MLIIIVGDLFLVGQEVARLNVYVAHYVFPTFRKFTPSLSSFLQDPLDEMDPAQEVEEQYK